MTEAVILFMFVLAVLFALYLSWKYSGEAIKQWSAVIEKDKQKEKNEHRTP